MRQSYVGSDIFTDNLHPVSRGIKDNSTASLRVLLCGF